MYELKKIRKVFRSKFVGTGPSSYKKRTCPAALSQRLRNAALGDIKNNKIRPCYLNYVGETWNI